MTLESALDSLKHGEFVLLFDSAGRENEIDMVVAAEFVTPEHVARMRQYAGGLLCVAIDHNFASSLGLRYMHEILSETLIENKEMIMGLAPYGDHPTFSLSVNHYQTYTGITDKDRSLTIREMANIFNIENKQKKFVSSFKTPGTLQILVTFRPKEFAFSFATESILDVTSLLNSETIMAIFKINAP